jgi:hypothetical protein
MATGRVPTTANSPLTAKGDLFGYSTAPARLAVGNNGESLVADSSTSTGLRYTAGTVQANPLLNAGAQVWQRGTSFSFSSAARQYTADRWEASLTNGNGTVARQATGDTTNLPNIQYGIRVQRTAGQTATGGDFLAQNIESINSIPFSGKTVTVSYYARAGANFSGTFSPWFGYGTGTDQNVFTGLTGQVTLNNTAVTLTTTWQRFSFTVAVPATATQLAFYFQHVASGTAGAADYFDVTGTQIDIGSVALPFRTYAGTIQGELAACQRYYHRFNGSGTNDSIINSGLGFSTTVAMFVFHLGTTMRTAPSLMDLSNQGVYRPANATSYSGGTWVLNQGFDNSTRVIYTHGSAIFTAGESLIPSSTSATNYIGFSAEL